MNKLFGHPARIINQSLYVALGRNFSYKSDLALDRLYPSSRLQLFTPPPLSSIRDDGKFSGFIPVDKLQITYSRSSGPGGQNVNKTDTKVDLRFHVQSAEWISESVRERMATEHKNQINKEGFFVIKSELTRSQQLNVANCLEKIRTIVRALEQPERKDPTPETLALAKKRHEKAARERLFVKRRRAVVKSDRTSL